MIDVQHLLVDLDALLDTRLGCLIQHRPEAAAEMDVTAYRARLTDELWTLCEGVTEEEYKQWWAERDIETLQHSFATSIMMRLKAMTYNLIAVQAKQQFMTDLKVTVNTYPYRLDEDVKEAYRQAVVDVVAKGFRVEVVYLTPETLTPTHLAGTYHYYAIYDLDKWLTVHHEALAEHPMPSFSMNAPSLFFNRLPDETDIKDLGLDNPVEAFAKWELYMSAHVMLGFLPVVEYSQML